MNSIEISAALQENDNNRTNAEKFAELIENYIGITELDYELVHTLIEKIYIHERENIDGKEQGLSAEEIAANVAAGLLTSLVTNFSCLITRFYPHLGYILMGMAALVVGMVAAVNFADGNTGMGHSAGNKPC